MRPFDFVRASDPGEAAAQAGKSKAAAFVAGGTNLIDLMKLNVMAPDVLVDISRLGLDTIDDEAGSLVSAVGNCPIVICANKSDLPPAIEPSEVAFRARNLGAPLFATSARTGVGVEEAFQTLGRRLLGR